MSSTRKGARRQAPTVPEAVTGSLRLVVLAGEQLGRRIALERDEMTLGREDDCDIRFDNAKLSRRHAVIVDLGHQRFVIRDLGSQNGTFVNGAALEEDHILLVGDKLRLGTELLLQVAVHDPVEEQLRQRQRFEALGRATAGIAHDFNNLLGAMIANLDYLQRLSQTKTLGASDVADCLADVHGAAQRASGLSDRLVHFARGEKGAARPIDVGDVCNEVAQLVHRTFDRSISVETVCAKELMVTGDSLELHQVLMNLCINARDAMPNGGTLTLTAEHRDAMTITVSVADTGVGMGETTRAQIFQPFFTTKDHQGYGLGLATVREIVISLGGKIDVTSKLGMGTRFVVTLPCALRTVSKSQMRPLARVQERPNTQTPLTIMIVDDEATVRRSTRRVLVQAGHDVTEVDAGEDAVRRYESGPRPDVVVLDIDMPGMSGDATLARLREIDPTAVVVMMSGHRDRDRESSLRRSGAAAFLRKPASTVQILATIGAAAEAGPPSSSEARWARPSSG